MKGYLLHISLILAVIILIVIQYAIRYDDRDTLIHEFKCSQYEADVCVEYRRVKP